MTAFRLAVLSFSRHRFSTLITVVAIALSVAAGGVLFRVYRASEARFASLALGSDTLIGAKSGGIEMVLNALGGEGEYPGFLPYTLFQTLKAQTTLTFASEGQVAPPKLKSATPLVLFALYKSSRVIGTDASFLESRSRGGSYALASGRWPEARGEVVIGFETARQNDLKVGETVSVKPWFGESAVNIERPLKVSGVLAPTKTQWDRTLFTTVDEAHAVLEQFAPLLRGRSIWGAKVFHYALLNLEPEGFDSLQSLINQRSVGQLVRIDAVVQKLKDLGGVGADLGLFVTSFILILGGLAVLATLATRFEAMASQIAVLRALGYQKRELIGWLVWEGGFLAASGVLIGASLDAILFPRFQALLGQALGAGSNAEIGLLQSAPIWLAAVGATLVAVAIPALRLTRIEAHDALRAVR